MTFDSKLTQRSATHPSERQKVGRKIRHFERLIRESKNKEEKQNLEKELLIWKEMLLYIVVCALFLPILAYANLPSFSRPVRTTSLFSRRTRIGIRKRLSERTS